ncbi:histidine phosphatase [Corallococcus sp. H22C18031201]|nr:histidine phosphatase [Corallococcus sp. H22C18031201]
MAAHDLPLLIVRHAVAEDSNSLGDEARALTSEGRIAFRQHARKLARRVPLRGILTSPLVRAVQTAELLADAFGLSEVEVAPALMPLGGAHKRIIKLARERGPGWALVGHNPSLERAVALALGHSLPDKLRKGAAVALIPNDQGFTLGWVASPGRALLRP